MNGSKRLGRYRLIAEIGHGGMAEVYLALLEGELGFNKLLVLKQIRPELAEDPEMMAMFLDEARLSARLHHPNVVETHEVAQEGGRTFMAMEYLEGQSLHRILHRLRRHGGLPPAMHLQILADMLAGLHHAHELTDWDETPLGVVHRDVTPQNVFVTYEGTVKVVDFGIAKVKGASAETRVGVVKGKVAYMAPEQARSEPVDRRTDVFAAGVMLWEAATGVRPFRGLSDVEILHRLIRGEFPSARAENPALPEALEAILTKAIAPSREERYATAADLRVAIEGYLDTMTERPHPRELGRLVSQHFEEDRARLRARLDEELRENPAGRTRVPRIVPMDSIVEEGTLTISEAGETVRHPNHSSGTGSSLRGVAHPPAPRPLGRHRVVAGAVLGIAAIAAVTVALWRSRPVVAPEPPRVAIPASSPAVVPAPPAHAAPKRVALRVRALPPQARILLDGSPLDGNPFAGVLPADTASHELRIEALHHLTRRQTISLEQDSTLEVILVADPAAAPPRATPPVVKGPLGRPQSAKEDDKVDKSGKGKRSLDRANPYEH
jgi:serine/threonine protein kinase